MPLKNKPWILLIVSVLFIALSTQIYPGASNLLGVVQTLLLGVGMVGCCMAIWSFGRAIWGK